MLVPQGKILHGNLSTAYVKLEALLGDLQKNRFSGYVQVIAWEFKGTIVICGGELVNASTEGKQDKSQGRGALESIAARTQDKDAVVNVHVLPEPIIETLLRVGRCESLHKDLDSDFVSLDKLIAKLASDQHTRYVQVLLKGDAGYGCITLAPRQPADCVFLQDTHVLNGKPALAALIDAATLGATFEAYEETASPRGAAVDASSGTNLNQTRWIGLWEEILSQTERTADEITGKGHFKNAFDRVLLDKAAKYGFLDPHAKEFSFQNGHVTYQGGWEPKFNQALSECLTATVSKLAAEKPRARVTLRIKAALQALASKHGAEVRELVAETHLDLFDLVPYEQVLIEAQSFLGDRTEDFVARQCREHLGIEPQALTTDRLDELTHWIDTSSRLFLSPDKAQALLGKLSALAPHTSLPQGGKK